MIVLDTHVWVWWIGGDNTPQLSRRARSAIEHANTIVLSAASLIEVAWLHARQRLTFDRPCDVWMAQALAEPKVRLEPISPAIANDAATLDWSNRDPNDRLIIATARSLRAKLITKDDAIIKAKVVDTIW